MNKKKILIWGSSNHARYTIDTIEKENKYDIGFLYDPTKEEDSYLYEYQVLGNKQNLAQLMVQNGIDGGTVAIGDNYIRKKVCDSITKMFPEFNFITTIHPSAQIGKNVRIGKGVLVMAGVTINPDAIVGNCCFLGTQASLEHGCVMDDFSSLSAGVVTGGYIRICECSALAIGVTTFDRITIGKNSVVGGGALVTKDIPESVIAYGRPAKVVRQKNPGEKYLK